MDKLISILAEAIWLWYNGLGQAVVGATCPFVAGPLVLLALYLAPEWIPVLRQIVADLRRGRAALVSMMCGGYLGMRRAALVLIRRLAGIMLGRGQAYRDWEKGWLEKMEAASKVCGGGKAIAAHSERDACWDRPARLWRRISLALPRFWVCAAGICGVISILYVISLRPIRDQAEQLLEASQYFYLSLWMVAGGLFLLFFNFFSVMAIPLAALRAKGLWIEIRWRREEPAQERRYRLVTRSRVYHTGAVIPDKVRWKKPNLTALNRALRKAWQDGFPWQMSRWRKFWQDMCLHLLPSRIRPPAGHFYLLKREKGRWVVEVPKEGDRIKIKRPAVRRVEILGQGHHKVLREGDVITFQDEQWYLLIERLYPE